MNNDVISLALAGKTGLAAVAGTANCYSTPPHLLERFQRSATTAWRCISARCLKCVRIGSLSHLRERDLEAWLSRHTSNGSKGEVSCDVHEK